jgi:hypothetical protein
MNHLITKFPSNYFFRQYFFLLKTHEGICYNEAKVMHKHHILPKSIFHINNTFLVEIDPKIHLLAHYLLWRGYQVAFGNEHQSTRKMANVLIFSMHGISETHLSSVDESFRQEFRRTLKKACQPVVIVPWNKGLPQSEEQKRKHSERMMGKPAWNKGLKTGIKTSGCFQAGHEPWNKGKPWSPETKQKMRKPKRSTEKLSKAKMGISTGPRSEETRRKISEKVRAAWVRRKDINNPAPLINPEPPLPPRPQQKES